MRHVIHKRFMYFTLSESVEHKDLNDLGDGEHVFGQTNLTTLVFDVLCQLAFLAFENKTHTN